MIVSCVVASRAKALGMTVWALVRQLPAAGAQRHTVDKYVSVSVWIVAELYQICYLYSFICIVFFVCCIACCQLYCIILLCLTGCTPICHCCCPRVTILSTYYLVLLPRATCSVVTCFRTAHRYLSHHVTDINLQHIY